MSLTAEPSSWTKLSLFAVTWPIFVDTVLRMLIGTADVLMLSRLSDQAAGAIGLANEIIMFCILMFGFVGIGTSVALTQYIGAGKPETASRISALAITMNLLFGIVVSGALLLLSEPLMRWMNLDAELLELAKPYLLLVGGFIWIEALSSSVSSVIRANGHTKDVMYVTLGMNILNVTGNLVLIFGYLGFPAMGITGAVISTVVSRALALFVLFILMYRRLPAPIRLNDYVTFDKRYMGQILSIGLPAAGEQLAWQSQHMMVFSFINLLGQSALAAHVYMFNISYYFMALAISVGIGTEIIVGHMVGAGQTKLAYHRLLRSLKISMVLTIAVVALAALFRYELFELFTDDPAIISVGVTLMLLSIIIEPGRTFNLVVINSLRAAGDARFPVVMGVLSMWGICVPLAYLLGIHYEMGLIGIWLAFTVDEWLRGIVMLLRWRSRIWEKKALVQAEPAALASHAS
ncbi:MATE family efflux transporter [Paenibacillus sp. YYML68]|uniref:MATE family efflux transporter n=1 Tax=Paenibacillus sp. YYML68 TaxID=2909250 RepID=UPI00248F70EC|nr:MATE family efflux transporter [Paenibacillus sp. YYML68]